MKQRKNIGKNKKVEVFNLGIFGDWKGENLLSNIMFIYLIIMVVLMMFSPIIPREIYGAIMFVMFGGFVILIIVTPISTFWIGYQKANTSVLEGWFDLEPGVTEFTQIQIAEEVPVEDLSPKEKEDLKVFMDEYDKQEKIDDAIIKKEAEESVKEE